MMTLKVVMVHPIENGSISEKYSFCQSSECYIHCDSVCYKPITAYDSMEANPSFERRAQIGIGRQIYKMSYLHSTTLMLLWVFILGPFGLLFRRPYLARIWRKDIYIYKLWHFVQFWQTIQSLGWTNIWLYIGSSRAPRQEIGSRSTAPIIF